MSKTSGGHFVIPVKNAYEGGEGSIDKYCDITKTDTSEHLETGRDDNIGGNEADAVMLVMLSECKTNEDVASMHELVGHSNFVTMALEKDEEKEVQKIHRYFGHKSSRKTWELFAKAGKLKGKKKAVIDLLDKCKICCELRKTPPRPKVGMPAANTFNEVVGLDLKVLGNGKYILWIVDMFSKVLKGHYIESKTPETMLMPSSIGFSVMDLGQDIHVEVFFG